METLLLVTAGVPAASPIFIQPATGRFKSVSLIKSR
jgi:hypothetical protein